MPNKLFSPPGFSDSGRRSDISGGVGPSVPDLPRRGRTRPDPLAGIWNEEVVPMLEASPDLRAVAVFDELMRLHPELGPGVRRTVERRVRDWKLEHGPERDVVFRQSHEPGVLGLSDFTDMSKLGVTIAGVPLAHSLYHFRLAYSGFEHAHVVLGGESFVALSEGLQDAVRLAGGVPRYHRTDSLSAAFSNLGLPDAEDITVRYDRLCAELGTTPTRNNRGRAQENGGIEGPHGHLKRTVKDALLLRGSCDFPDLASYREFIGEVVSRCNAKRTARIEVERAALGPLPEFRSADYEEASVRVTSSSGFTLRKVFYSVPSRYIGHILHARIFDDRLEVMAGGRKVLDLPRGRAGKGGRASHVVNYRHVIHSLRKKPMALLSLVYRDKLFPSDPYRLMFELALARLTARAACRMAVELLAMAHELCCERELESELSVLLDKGELPDLDDLRIRLRPAAGDVPRVTIELPPLSDYDVLIDFKRSDAEDGEACDEE